ncbi:MAG: T9SS type A sorting domain-containing protein, partial [Candidatus Kapaibacterium sp.]
TITSNADDTAPTFNNKSEWTGIGYNAGLVVSDDESEICIGATDQLSLTITNNSEQDILIDRLSLQRNGVDIADIDGDGGNDISISNNTTGINVTRNGGEWTVNILYTPTGYIPPLTKLDLNIEHSYGDLIGINQNIGAITVASKFFDGSTSSNVTGAAPGTPSDPNKYDKQFMISIGDDFFYEINTNTDVTNADVQSIDVELKYNRFFVQPEFSETDFSKIELANTSMVIAPSTFAIEPVVGGKVGSQVIKFTVQSTDGTPVLANPTTLIRLPFLAVLPADSEEFDPSEVLGTKGKDLGLFDMSHSISDADCYTHSQDRVEVGIREICTGDLRLLYIGDLAGTPPVVRPNPISTNGGSIEYSVPFDRPGQIVLYDASMKQVAVLYDGIMKQGRQTVEIPSSQLANGSYFFKIEMGQEKAMGTVIIQK